jgi:cardiolipin synthase
MLDAIQSARQFVHLENYIIRSDQTGRRIADALCEARHRGVEVRVLYDSFGSLGTSSRFWQRLTQAGVRLRSFNPLNPLRPFRSIRRNHRKYLGVDAVVANVGGLCVGDEWTGNPSTGEPPWRDTAVEVRGPAVPAIEQTFVHAWKLAGGTIEDAGSYGLREPSGDAVVRVLEGLPGKARVLQAVALLGVAAAERIWITDAYLLLVPPLQAGLLAAIRDGVDVRLLVPGRTDIPAVRALTRVGYRDLLEGGARIWEWQGPMLHAKTVVVDDEWFKVGSSNINPSSIFGNYELDLMIRGEVAREASHQFRRDLEGAVEVVLKHRRMVPRRIAARWSRRVEPAAKIPRLGPTQAGVRRRAVMTLRQVAGGARRSLLGTAVGVTLGIGALFIALPRVMSYLVAGGSLLLAGLALWVFFRRRGAGEA